MDTNEDTKNIDSDTLEMLEDLKEEMGVDSVHDVIRALARQASNRAAILCPRCGHNARQTEKDKAECTSCMSPLHLAEGFMVVLAKKQDK